MLELVDDDWAADSLDDEELPTKAFETPLMDDDDFDGEPVVVGTGTSASAFADEQKRREERWNDLGLDQIDDRHLLQQSQQQQSKDPASSSSQPASGASHQQQQGGYSGGNAQYGDTGNDRSRDRGRGGAAGTR